MQPFVVVFPATGKPAYLGEIRIGAGQKKPDAIPGEVWLRLTAVVADYPAPKLQGLVHSIEIYMPGVAIPIQPNHDMPYHDVTFSMTECPICGTIRSIVKRLDQPKLHQESLCHEEIEVQAA